MDQLFSDYLPRWSAWEAGPSAYPALNVWEDDSNVTVEAELPGCTIEDLELSVLGTQFTLRGERKFEVKEGWTCHRQERPTGSFVRTIELSAPIDADKVQASFKHGVLTVTLPKAEAAKPRRIEVRKVEKK
jgi:HSP20 family protein